MDENKNMNEVVEETTTDVIPTPATETQDDDNSAGKLGLAILGVGAAAVTAGGIALVKKIKGKKAAKEESEEKPKAKENVVRGDKLSFKERVLGYRYRKESDCVAVENENPEDEAE